MVLFNMFMCIYMCVFVVAWLSVFNYIPFDFFSLRSVCVSVLILSSFNCLQFAISK